MVLPLPLMMTFFCIAGRLAVNVMVVTASVKLIVLLASTLLLRSVIACVIELAPVGVLVLTVKVAASKNMALQKMAMDHKTRR